MPVVARGAGTSLSGGALPDTDGVVLSLAKFKRILAIDPLARTAVVQPGVRNLAISEAAAAYGLYYAPDPSSQIACSIGGNVAENAGGVHCLKYGLTVHNVRRVRGVLITGEVVEFGGDALDSAGYDLLALINGSEGLLAVITEITVKLTPKPQLAQVALAAFDDVEKAGAAVGAIIGAGIIPAGLEMMDQPRHARGRAIRARRLSARRGRGAAGRVRRHAGGSRRGDGRDPARADANRAPPTSACRRTRRSGCCSGRAARRRFPRSDASRPTTTASTARFRARRCRACCAQSPSGRTSTDCACANVFHAGDGNLHPLILFDANKPGETERTIAFGDRILELCIEVGGTVTGEHGVGVEKLATDVRAVQRGGARALSRDQGGVRSELRCSIPARPCRRCTVARSSARCTFTTARSRIRTCRVSDEEFR